jgi:acyl-CoA hydrolase
MTELVLPEDTNPRGSIFGGRVLALIDKCAAIVAMRHARTRVLTASLDSVDFRNPVRLGEVLVLRGRINAAFDSSMEIEVEVHAEDPLTGRQTLTTTAFVTMVSTGPDGRPAPAPALSAASEDDRRRADGASVRRRQRLARRGAR